MNLERLISRSMSTPRSVRVGMRRAIMRRPTGKLRYTQLVEHLSQSMVRAYALGYRSNGASLRNDSRAARLADYKRRARAVLGQYGETASRDVAKTYRNARAKGASVKVATNLALRRFAMMGHTAPASNRLQTLYQSALRSAFQQGIFDSTNSQAEIWGYRYLARDLGGHQDPATRDAHWQYHMVTLPKEHEFWRKIWPPIDWNCRCRIKAFRRPQKIQRPPPNPIRIETGFQGQDFELQ